MKKFLSIILALVMIATAVPFAFAEESEISLGEVITITAPDYDEESGCLIKFVADEDMKLMFRSLAYDEFDTVCYFYDSEMSFIAHNDDYAGLDFCIDYDFIAGETYYFEVFVYSGPATFDVTLECAHIFVDGICQTCNKVCTHEVGVGKYPVVCECGQIFEGIEMTEGTEYVIDFEAINNEDGWGRFIPGESGVYCFESLYGEYAFDCSGTVYDEGFNEIAYNDDYDETMMFRIFIQLEAGATYFVRCKSFYEDASNTVKVERAKHTTDDGAVHSDMTVCEEIEANCSTIGYSEGVFCNDCEEFIFGHEELGYEPDYHIDDEWDGVCDLCGEVLFEMCPHICHSENPFFAFIWKIANFFHKLFGISPECECGEWHYHDESAAQ